MAFGGLQARANEVQSMMRGAEQTFQKTFAEGFARKPWPRSRLGQARLALAKRATQASVGTPSPAWTTPYFQSSGDAIRPSDIAAASLTAARPRNAEIDRQQAKEPAPAPGAPPRAPEEPGVKWAPIQLAKAEPLPPPLPMASVSSPAGFAFKDCDFCPELVVAPKGEFVMGSDSHPRSKPAHKVRLPHSFAIGRYEVTYAEWDHCVVAGACAYRPVHQGSASDAIGNLSWDDAKVYLRWMSEETGQIYRLPSEAEWEYAARADARSASLRVGEAGSHSNCVDCGAGTSGHPAARSHKPNPFGLYDLAGNLAEWVEDCWHEFL